MARFLLYLLNLVFVIVLGWILNHVLRRLLGTWPHSGGSRRVPRSDSAPVIEGQTARDPVCGMFVSTELSHRLTRGNETLHFCSRECLERYQKNETRS
jgi:YHS domain-containing protein